MPSACRFGSVLRTIPLLVLVVLLAPYGRAQLPGEVIAVQKISELEGGFIGTLDDNDGFGVAATGLGDLDGDGTPDLAVGVDQDDDGGNDRGAVWILFLAPDGTVGGVQKISDTAGGLPGPLDNNDGLGRALAGLGDLRGDGTTALAVGALGDGVGGNNRGVVWMLFLNGDGTVAGQLKIGDGMGGFGGNLDNNDGFARSVANIGDLDGDGVTDLAVGADQDDDGGNGRGAVWILFLEQDGSVRDFQKISDTMGGFGGNLSNGDGFGRSVASLGDLDGAGGIDLAVGAIGDDDGGNDRGAVWILSLNDDGTVAAQSKISATSGGLPSTLSDDGRFGVSVAGVGDIDGDAVVDLVVGADRDGPLAARTGAVWQLLMQSDGTVREGTRLGGDAPLLAGALDDLDQFGSAVAALGDLDGDGQTELAIGASGDDDGDSNGGASWVAFLEPLPEEGGGEPFIEVTGAIEGRPGRITLLPPVDLGEIPQPPDFIDEPVIIVPRGDGGTVSSQSVTAEGDFNTVSEGVGEFETGMLPSDSATGSFGAGAGGGAFAGALVVPDVVTANTGDDSISLLIGAGDGTFAPPLDTLLLVDTAPIAIEVGDLNDDGFDDVAVAGATGVTTLLGDGASGFGAQAFTPVADLTDLILGDVDGNGTLDVVTASGSVASGPGGESGFATVLLGAGDGTLVPGTTFGTGQAIVSVLLGDMDGDMQLDALLAIHEFDGGPAGEPQGRLELFVGDGAGGFGASTWSGFAAPNAQGLHPTYGGIGDLDGDGLLDAVYSSSDNISHPVGTFAEEYPPLVVTILTNDGAGGFAVEELGTSYSGKGVGVLLEDFTPAPLDGITDVALVWWQDAQAGLPDGGETLSTYLAVLAGDGVGSFFNPAANQYATGDEPGNGALADLDDDGSLDILVPNRDSNSLTILLGDGQGDYVPALSVPFVDQLDPGTLPPGDWVGGPLSVEYGELQIVDGIVIFGFTAVSYNAWVDRSPSPDPSVFASLSLFLANGLGGLFGTQYLPLPRGGEFTQLDLTDDGNTDLIVTQHRGAGPDDAVHVYVGLGPTFAAVDTVPVVFPAPVDHTLSGGLLAADVTGDDVADILTTSISSLTGTGHLVVYPAVAGSLGAPVVFDLGATWADIRSVDLGDVTGDGLADVLLGEEDARLFVAQGLGGGSFAAATPSANAAAVGGGAIGLVDANGDGPLDIVAVSGTVVGGTGQAFVRTLINDGSAAFALETLGGAESTSSEGRPLDPLIGDVNGDDAPDLVIAHGPSDAVSVHLNRLSAFETYGAGKPGSGGLVPDLRGKGFTTPGGLATIVLSDALGGAPALLQLGVGRDETGLIAVETVLVQILLNLPGTPGAPGEGGFELPLPLPDLPDIAGVELTWQVLVLDPGAGAPAPFSIAASNGLALLIVE